jgi:adenylylsulfate kinase
MAQDAGFTVWLTGMLGAGKTTLAGYIEARLRQVGRERRAPHHLPPPGLRG